MEETGTKTNKTISENFEELKALLQDSNVIKKKELKIPSKLKVKGNKLKQGYIGVLHLDENRNARFEKIQLKDSTLKGKDDIYHSTDGREINHWDGKFPFVIQPSWRLNPLNLSKDIPQINETYGQKYTMARMLQDTIKVKKPLGNWIWWILGIGALALIAYYFFGAKGG